MGNTSQGRVVLAEEAISALLEALENKLSEDGCDHTLRHTLEWARATGTNVDDLIDALHARGGYCDCEVCMNVDPGDDALRVPPRRVIVDEANPWLIPPKFVAPPDQTDYGLVLVAEHQPNQWSFADDGELVVPANAGATPTRRILAQRHFFVGSRTGLPTQYAHIFEADSRFTAHEFVSLARDGGEPSLARFGLREAHFLLSEVNRIGAGKVVAASLSDITTMSGKRCELRLHEVR